MWAVLYDDGMSLTIASELLARSLAEAERRRGRRVTVQRLDDAETHPRSADSVPEPEPIRILVFRVQQVRRYTKDKFPTEAVYLPTLNRELRLITCGGEFDHASGHYRDNIVVYATLVA
jgi:hypothetical protein